MTGSELSATAQESALSITSMWRWNRVKAQLFCPLTHRTLQFSTTVTSLRSVWET
jgi:hypothetical protein